MIITDEKTGELLPDAMHRAERCHEWVVDMLIAAKELLDAVKAEEYEEAVSWAEGIESDAERLYLGVIYEDRLTKEEVLESVRGKRDQSE